MHCEVTTEPADARCRGTRGSAMVASLVFLFAFTSLGVVWLARDVNRSVANRSAAQSVAFQAARAGAQQIDVGGLRDAGADDVRLEAERVAVATRRAADDLFDEYGVDGTVVDVAIDGATVTVTVTIRDPAGDQTASGSAEPRTGP